MNCYIGIKHCGCVVCAIVDTTANNYYYEEHLSETIKEWRREGLEVNKVDVEEARNRLKVCNCQTKLKESSK